MEKSIIAKDVTLNETLPLQTIMNFYKEIKSWGGQVFIIQNRKMVTCSSLPKLIAFMLTIDSKKPVKLILEGNNAEYMVNLFTEKLSFKNEARNSTGLLKSAIE